MKSVVALLIAAVAASAGSAFAGAGRGEVDLTKLPPPSDKKDLTYAKDIQPLFKASCFGCHGETGRASGGLRLHTLEDALKGGNDGKVIETGKSANSMLVVAVARLDPQTAMPRAPRGRRGPGGPGAPGGAGTNATPAMPPAGGAPGGDGAGAPPPPKNFTAEEVGLIRAWIDQGAK